MSYDFSLNKTSARLLMDFATKQWCNGDDVAEEHRIRYLMVCDLYIKARSYIIMNKTAFVFSILLVIWLMIWPLIANVCVFFNSPAAQTTITALAAFAVSVYNHYKKRQMYLENLLRVVIYSKIAGEEELMKLIEKMIKEMERIDAGFAFSESMNKKEDH